MKITLIGSSRFKDLYEKYNRVLTLQGHVVYSITMVSSQAVEELPVKDKMILDLVHLRKIQESDAVVLVTDHTHYVGESTTRELAWARILGKSHFESPDHVPSTGVRAIL